jgi:hypothetical protein
MTTGTEPLPLDPNVLEGIADVICGDDSTSYYRSGRQLERLFAAAGWRWVRDLDGGQGRRAWVVDQLNGSRVDGQAMEALLTRLIDPREYLEDDSARAATLADLNRLLVLEGLELTYDDDGPQLRPRTRQFQRPNSEVPVELTADLGGLVRDETFGALLRKRLDEANICWHHGAHLAAVIMLGSLLEGVLLDFARNQHDAEVSDNLARLIGLAGTKGWLAKDVVDYAHVLRNHRNLVHPNKQHTDGHAPDGDTVMIAWNVVVAAINDLAAFDSREEA